MAPPSSSLSNVVSDLLRASMGASVSTAIADDELDQHVRALILKEAKQKDQLYQGQQGVRAYLPDTGLPENNLPKPNKRFLTTVIKSVDDHNATIIDGQARIAQAAKEAIEAEARAQRRARADEAAGERLRRLMGGGRSRRERSSDGWKGKGREDLGEEKPKRSRSRSRDPNNHRHRDADALDNEGSGSGHDRRGERHGSSSRRKEDETRYERRRRHRSKSPGSISGDDRLDRKRRRHENDHSSRSHKSSRQRNNEDSERSRSCSPFHSRRKRRSSQSPKPTAWKSRSPNPPHYVKGHPTVSSSTPEETEGASQEFQLRDYTPSDSPTPHRLSSKMDKYFDPAYNPVLDIGPTSNSLQELVPEGAFDEWNRMLETLKLRKEAKEDRKRLEKVAKRDGKKRKRDKVEANEAEERQRRIRLGLETPGVMDVAYTKRGSVREWDVGKKDLT